MKLLVLALPFVLVACANPNRTAEAPLRPQVSVGLVQVSLDGGGSTYVQCNPCEVIPSEKTPNPFAEAFTESPGQGGASQTNVELAAVLSGEGDAMQPIKPASLVAPRKKEEEPTQPSISANVSNFKYRHIEFVKNSSNMPSLEEQEVLYWVRHLGGKTWVIRGLVDSSEVSGRSLALARAVAVKKFFVSKGVNAGFLEDKCLP